MVKWAISIAAAAFGMAGPFFALGQAPLLSPLETAAIERFVVVEVEDSVEGGCWNNAQEVEQTIINRFNRFGIDAGNVYPADQGYWERVDFIFSGLGDRITGGCLVTYQYAMEVPNFTPGTTYRIMGYYRAATDLGYAVGPDARDEVLVRVADNAAAEVAIAMQEFRRTDRYEQALELIEAWRERESD